MNRELVKRWVYMILTVIIILLLAAGVLFYGTLPISECPTWVVYLLALIVFGGRKKNE